MIKEKFIKSTIILIIGGFITKILGMLIRIIMVRVTGLEATSIYMLVLPTFSLFMALSQLGFASSISKLVAEERHNNQSIISSTIVFSFLLNIFLMVIIILSAKFIANNLLHNHLTYYPILSIALVLPFDSMSSILRGYFFGKQRMIPHVISNVAEQLVRISLMIFLIPTLIPYGVRITVTSLILVNVFSELVSSVILIFLFPRKVKLERKYLLPKISNLKKVLSIALPTTGGRLIGSIAYFFEPIILTFVLINNGYLSSYITTEYGVIQGFVFPLLLLPSFFTGAISSALLPIISKAYVNNEYTYIKRKLKQAIMFSLGIGVPLTIILMLFPEYLLKLIYNSNHGALYLRVIAPIFLLHYIQSPLASVLQSIGKARLMMYDNLKGAIFKIVTLYIFSYFKIGLFSLLISSAVNIIVVTISHFVNIRKSLKIS